MTKPPGDTNHEILLALQTQLEGVGDTLKVFIEKQGVENQRLHERIDNTQDRTTKAVESLKDSFNSRGRVSGGFILSLAAVFLSLCALIGGAVHSYMSIRLEGLKPSIQAHEEALRVTELRRGEIFQRVEQLQAGQARADGAAEANQRWLMRELDRRTGSATDGP